MKRKGISLLLVLVCVVSLLYTEQPAQVKAASSIGFHATAISKTKVKLTWKKKSVASYRIYRAPIDKYENVGKSKKIATISKTKTSYTTTVSYQKSYHYEIRGYNKKGKEIYFGEDDVYAGVSNVVWDEYLFAAAVTPTSIPLEWTRDNGLKPAGYEIYRSENKKTYKKIKTILNKKDGYVKYTDKTVKATHTYYYKIRAYCKISGKTVYGKYSDTVDFAAVNSIGTYDIQVLPGDVASPCAVSGCATIAPILASPTSICMVVTSDAMNGTLKTYQKIVWDATFYYKAENRSEQGTAYGTIYQLKDGKWKKSGEDATIKAGETFYIRFDLKKENMENLASATGIFLYGDNLSYNGHSSVTNLSLPEDHKFTLTLDTEMNY